ncbi:tetratricopeptide repeat protein [bacterium]|nr:tetratricopeptide repeat protein [bacterium]
MLGTFSKSQKNKKQPKSAELANKGFVLIERKEYKQATIELTLALEEDSDSLLPTLDQKFEEFKKKNDYEAMRSIGLVILRKRAADPILLNTIGNCSRRLKDFKQANHFYHQALKANSSYLTAFHNLAASLANIDRFDSEVTEALGRFSSYNDFILPDYQNSLVINKDDDFETTCKRLKTAIKENWKKQSISEGQKILQNDIWNLCLYALSQKKIDLALENIQKLKRQDSPIQYLDMLLEIANHYNHQDPQITINGFLELLKKKPNDRYLNVNLAVLFKKTGNALQANKFFLICSDLLEKSAGFFSFQSLLKTANRKFTEKDYKTALVLYQKLSVEIDTVELWEKLGILHFQMKNYTDAVNAFNQILRLDPDSKLAKQRLHQLYTQYLDSAHALIKDKKFSQASIVLERALQIDRPPELLEETAKIYKILREFDKAEVLIEESHNAQEKIKNLELEKERLSFMIKGKEYTKRKEFTLAIENLEKASRIKLDKDVFMYLAHIYKGLKRTRALQDLMNRWHRQNDAQEEREEAV